MKLQQNVDSIERNEDVDKIRQAVIDASRFPLIEIFCGLVRESPKVGPRSSLDRADVSKHEGIKQWARPSFVKVLMIPFGCFNPCSKTIFPACPFGKSNEGQDGSAAPD